MIKRNIDIDGTVREVPTILKPIYKLLGIGTLSAKFYVDIWNPETNETWVDIYIQFKRKKVDDITEMESEILSIVQDACLIHNIPEADLIAPKLTYAIAHPMALAMVDDAFLESDMFIEKYYTYTVDENGLTLKRR